MPELPEVETIRRQLDKRLRGRVIVSVKLLRTGREIPRGRRFMAALLGRRLKSIKRRAKLLIWRFMDGGAMIAHLKMTGRFVFAGRDYAPGKHDRAIFRFRTGDTPGRQHRRELSLVWSDVRQFGFVRVVTGKELNRILSAYGPEPLATPIRDLAARLVRPATRAVKTALLNQETIAGVGNIYADEALHRAGIRPTRRLGRLTARDCLRLCSEIKNVLREALVFRGTSANNYVDAKGERGGFLSRLRVYGRGGQACRSCGTAIKRMVVCQRGTHYCPGCQK